MDKRVTVCDGCGVTIIGDGPQSGLKVLATGDHMPDPVEHPDETARVVRGLASDRANEEGYRLPARVDVCSTCIRTQGLLDTLEAVLESQLTERGRVQMGETE